MEFVELLLKLALFALELSIKNRNEPLMQIPEVVEIHPFQVWVLHASPRLASSDSRQNQHIKRKAA